MGLEVTLPDEIETVCNSFDAKEELADITRSMETNYESVSPIEVAALQLTMRQVDKELETPAVENFKNQTAIFPMLATESLKESIGNKLKAFIEGLKKLFGRVIRYCNDTLVKIKSKFSRKPKPDTNEKTPEEKTLKVAKNLVSWDGDVSDKALIQIIDIFNSAIQVVTAGTSAFSIVHSLNMIFMPKIEEEIDDRRGFILDAFKQELKTTDKNGTTIGVIADGVTMVMEHESPTVLPQLIVEDLGEVVLKSSDVSSSFYHDSLSTSSKLLGAMSKLTRDQAKNYEALNKFKDFGSEEAMANIKLIQPILTRMTTLLMHTLGFASKLFDTRDELIKIAPTS